MTETNTAPQELADQDPYWDLANFSEREIDEINTPWEPPGDRYPTRRQWDEMNRVGRWRWEAAVGKEGSWQFGAARAPRTAADWDKLDDAERTPEVFEGLTHGAKVELMDRGLDPTTLETPPASEETEGTPPSESERITGQGFKPLSLTDPIPPGEPTYEFIVKTQRAQLAPLVARYERGEFTGLVDDEEVAGLLTRTGEPDTPAAGEAVQKAHYILSTAATRTQEPAPFIPVETRTRNLGPKGVVVTQRDSLGRTREVARMTSDEVAQALAQEEQDTAADAEFGDNPLQAAIEGFGDWSPSRRRAFMEKHPAEFNALAEALSLEAEG